MVANEYVFISRRLWQEGRSFPLLQANRSEDVKTEDSLGQVLMGR